jgi:POT family proton-dependent oligopeptide transporter
MSKYRTAPIPTKSLPKGIPYIIGNEAAERFSFYGMKGILVVFMTSYLWVMKQDPNSVPMEDAQARYWYHFFTGSVYLTPFFGAIIADAFLGKYLTIMLLSIVYCIGHGMLALMGGHLPGMEGELSPDWFLFLGLAIIAIGSGGVKPCVSAHVGDQFGASNSYWLNRMFAIFYLSINLGAFLSNLATPWLLHWYGPHLAFGVPGVLMALATFVFWLGRNKFIHVPPGGWKFLRETFSWTGISALLKLGVIYVFVAVFWALFDQTGSSWVIQAESMDRTWLGVTWLESQIQGINPIMILVLVPLFSFVIYPLVDKVYLLTPIRKLTIGLFLMVPGFAVVALVQSWIDNGEAPSIAWQVLAYVILTASEVMVSITCLEFSYTQAPRKMKSLVMATFLFSVTLGNYFTMGVNGYIQIDGLRSSADSASLLVAVDQSLKTTDATIQGDLDSEFTDRKVKYVASSDGGYSLRMQWAGFVGDDQVVVHYDNEGVRTGVDVKGKAEVKAGVALIRKYWTGHEHELPSLATGTSELSSIKDPWGHPLRYSLVGKYQAKVSSMGPDGVPLTADDINDAVRISPPESLEAEQSWLARAKVERRARLGQESTEEATGTPRGWTFSDTLSVGGGSTLDGAAYFRFFTYLMLGAAICFIPVAILYRPKDYLQDEDGTVPTNESLSGAIGDQ